MKTQDNNPRFHPDILTDIMGWNFVDAFPRDYFDVIIASPPCTEYSAAMTCRARDLEMADQIVQRTLDIINYLQPRHWFIENPKTGLLKGRPFMKEYAFVDVDYCQFSSWGYQKPTRIWGPMYLKNLKSRVCAKKPVQTSLFVHRDIGGIVECSAPPPKTELPAYPWRTNTEFQRG